MSPELPRNSLFYAVLALLQSVGEVPSRHSSAIGIFDREFVLKGAFAKEHSAWLHRAFELRQTTDYRVQELPTTAEARTLLEKATTFVGEIEQYLKHEGSPPKQ
ncbi:MAG: HEPN domain-containing protein [candidate division WOR-3 bacterium]|nr:HEPN domain-containing protein [candidate division WOR-3 bacterium]